MQAAALAAWVHGWHLPLPPASEPTRLDERQECMGEAIAQIEKLRDRFALARKRLEAIPKTGLSDDGQPYIREIVEALQSFAEWFGKLTLDDMSLTGSAYRVCDTVNGLDAIVDWVGLHRSQQFAADIREHVGELVEQSEALDESVSAAFLVKRTASTEVRSRNRRVPQSKRDAIVDGIQGVASLAGHLAVRLQRIAVMVPSVPVQPGNPRQQTGSRKPVGRPQNDESLARELLTSWKAFEPEEGRKTKDRYLAQRPDVQVLKTEDARQRKIASLRVALESALHLRREKTKQRQRARG